MRTESECNNHIYHFHKDSLADLIGHFIPESVIWKKFSTKRNICSAGTSHTYVRKVNRLFSNLWSLLTRGNTQRFDTKGNPKTAKYTERLYGLLTHFCIASSKRDYGKPCRSRSDPGELGAQS